MNLVNEGGGFIKQGFAKLRISNIRTNLNPFEIHIYYEIKKTWH